VSSKPHSATRILTSWKEIAAHLGRGVRTAQRWEQEFGLPIRRPNGKQHSTVMALADEIDAWVRTFPNVVRTLPYDGLRAARSIAASPATTRVLVINDNEVQLYATERALTAVGYSVTRAASGREALELAAGMPDIILLDVNLPDIHGFELMRRLKANPQTCGIPVIFVSATYGAEGAGGIALQLGAKAFFQHPLTVSQLQVAIEASLAS
jgi:CheY-like chemotaxis protein